MRGSLILGMNILIFSLLVLILPYCEGKIQLSFFRWIINFCSWTVYERRDVFRKKIHKSDDLFTYFSVKNNLKKISESKLFSLFYFFYSHYRKERKENTFFSALRIWIWPFSKCKKKIVCEIIKNDGYLRPNFATYCLQRNEL